MSTSLIPERARPLGSSTLGGANVRASRATLEVLHELKRRTGYPLDVIIYALAAEALARSEQQPA